ncbi:hypothetical protein CSB09_04710 [Candidatus Gracilibacteria bacterium]|nr:MAG: hypothetical protein CSB09_04710 [Candidatus Gracilibacteria bacterium]
MISRITRFIYECFHLKQIKHEGWRVVGISNPESVAGHSLTASQIAYILAKMEGADAEKVVSIVVWHDIAEVRIGDLHKLGSYYFSNKHTVEEHVIRDQCKNLEFGKDLQALLEEYEKRETKEGKIAKDADILEQAFQGQIYFQCGYKGAGEFVKNMESLFYTESAKKLWQEMQKTDFYDWSRRKYFPKK